MNQVLFHLIFIIPVSENPGVGESFTNGEQEQPCQQALGEEGVVPP